MLLVLRTGQIGVTDVVTVVDHDDVRVWEVSLVHRGIEMWVNNVFGGQGPGYQVSIARSANATDWDRRFGRATLLTFYTPSDHELWNLVTDHVRSGLRVVAYRRSS